jgi:hypothetical protein
MMTKYHHSVVQNVLNANNDEEKIADATMISAMGVRGRKSAAQRADTISLGTLEMPQHTMLPHPQFFLSCTLLLT